MYVRQQPQETVHHFWPRFLLVKSKIKDRCDHDVVSVFHRNCTNERILNALNRRHIQIFTELSQVVQKYCTMKSTWKAQKTQLEPAAFKHYGARTKWTHPSRASDHQFVSKENKPFTGYRSVLTNTLTSHVRYM